MPRPAWIAVVALTAALLAGCGGNGNETVAHVGGEAITQKQLDAVVAHFRSEAQREGKDFPDEGSAGFKPLRNHLLGLLVYRTELRQAADRLGVKVSENQVSKRLPTPSGGEQEGDSGGDTFPRDSVVAQLLYEQIFNKVTRDVKAPNQAELSARRNEAMAAFVTRLQRETKVRYEPGYAPSP
jgi:SurA-like protein